MADANDLFASFFFFREMTMLINSMRAKNHRTRKNIRKKMRKRRSKQEKKKMRMKMTIRVKKPVHKLNNKVKRKKRTQEEFLMAADLKTKSNVVVVGVVILQGKNGVVVILLRYAFLTILCFIFRFYELIFL